MVNSAVIHRVQNKTASVLPYVSLRKHLAIVRFHFGSSSGVKQSFCNTWQAGGCYCDQWHCVSLPSVDTQKCFLEFAESSRACSGMMVSASQHQPACGTDSLVIYVVELFAAVANTHDV